MNQIEKEEMQRSAILGHLAALIALSNGAFNASLFLERLTNRSQVVVSVYS